MLRLFPLRVGLGLMFGLALLSGLSQVGAQDKKDPAKKPEEKTGDFERVRFDTVDQVELHGTFYPSSKGKRSSCVLLLHALGKDSQQEGWDKLAKELQSKGYAVLNFDFRGHGKSDRVEMPFWTDHRTNQTLKNYTPGKLKDKISYKDFPASYWPRLVDDIAAAKVFLDRRNDAGDCNSASMIIIGAGDGAALGAMWMNSEFSRYRITGNPLLPVTIKRDPNSEGRSLVAGVWLSMSPSLKGQVTLPVAEWIKSVGHENRVPMYFIYGAKDSTAENFAQRYAGLAKAGTKPGVTGSKAVPDTKLAGADLLTVKSLNVPELIGLYLEKVTKDNPGGDWDKRDVEKNPYIWQIGAAVPINAKTEGQKNMLPLPLNRFLR